MFPSISEPHVGLLNPESNVSDQIQQVGINPLRIIQNSSLQKKTSWSFIQELGKWDFIEEWEKWDSIERWQSDIKSMKES